MRRFFGITLLFLVIFFAGLKLQNPSVAHAQSACGIEILTRTIQYGEPAQIRINNLEPSGNVTNETFNLYIDSTGRWIDIGNAIANSNNEPVVINLQNDNDGNPLFNTNLSGTKVSVRRAGLAGTQYTLCTSVESIVMLQDTTPDPTKIGLCGDCSQDDCQDGLSCESTYCVPRNDGSEGSGCINTFQCNASQNLRCEGALLPSEWCAQNPSANTPLPGTCQPGEALPEPIYNCTTRGGQCGDTLDPEYCTDGVVWADCDGCFINPYTTDFNSSPSYKGSCVDGPPGTAYLKELGDTCSKDEECRSYNCSGGKCSVPHGDCLDVGHSVSPAYCENIGSTLCQRQRQNATDYLCCSSTAMCSDIGGETKFYHPPTSVVVGAGCFDGQGFVNTAVGCIPFQILSQTAAFFLAWGISIGGGIALFIMSIAALQFAMSGGVPQRVQNAKSLCMSALGGLLFLLLSVFLLRFIGVDVLGLFS